MVEVSHLLSMDNEFDGGNGFSTQKSLTQGTATNFGVTVSPKHSLQDKKNLPGRLYQKMQNDKLLEAKRLKAREDDVKNVQANLDAFDARMKVLRASEKASVF